MAAAIDGLHVNGYAELLEGGDDADDDDDGAKAKAMVKALRAKGKEQMDAHATFKKSVARGASGIKKTNGK